MNGNLVEGNLRNMTSLYLRHGNELLLLYRIGSKIVGDSYVASAGGHFESEELNDARACALRELYEETGIKEREIDQLSLRYITLRRKDNEIRQNYYFFAELKERREGLKSNEGRLEWFRMDELLDNMPQMPFTAYYVVKHLSAKSGALSLLRRRNELSGTVRQRPFDSAEDFFSAGIYCTVPERRKEWALQV